jgi:hypothetical protein
MSEDECSLKSHPTGVPLPLTAEGRAGFDSGPFPRAWEGSSPRRFAIAAPGATKRLKELARQEKQRAKAEKKEQRKREKAERAPVPEGVDPDIAGIVPGPQPPLEF